MSPLSGCAINFHHHRKIYTTIYPHWKFISVPRIDSSIYSVLSDKGFADLDLNLIKLDLSRYQKTSPIPAYLKNYFLLVLTVKATTHTSSRLVVLNETKRPLAVSVSQMFRIMPESPLFLSASIISNDIGVRIFLQTLRDRPKDAHCLP